MHSAGYSHRKIAKLLKIGRATVSKYIHGKFEHLCQKEIRSGLNVYHNYIVNSLQSGMMRKDVYRNIITKGYSGTQSTAYDYMNKVIEYYNLDISSGKSTSPEIIQKRKDLQKYDYLTRSDIFKHLWMNSEMVSTHRKYIFDKYPQLYELNICIKEFRLIFKDKHIPSLHLFIDKYEGSGINAFGAVPESKMNRKMIFQYLALLF